MLGEIGEGITRTGRRWRKLQRAGGQPLRPNHKGLKWLIVVGLASA